jgi:hypothetical protein
MKKLSIIIALFLTLPFIVFAQNDTIIKEGYVNFATLIFDFESYEFEGGNMAYYDCTGCTGDSIPYIVDFMSPGDFGGITFDLNPGQEVFFDATIVWAGMGQIQYPNTFNTEYPFTYSNNAVEIPADIKYLEMNGEEMIDGSWLFAKKDSVWNSVDSLGVTNLFAANNFKALVYFYPPSVGVLDPSVAKWVVFLYATDITNPVQNLSGLDKFKIYPNPTTNNIIVESKPSPSSIIQYRVFSVEGLKILEGKIDNGRKKIVLSSLPKGLYTLMIYNEKGDSLKAEKIIKE